MKNSRLPYAFPALRAAAVSAGILVFLGACAQQQSSGESEQQTPAVSGTTTEHPDNRSPLLMGDDVPERWRDGSEDTTQQDALESCNAYANAIVARDRRIDSDRTAGFDTGGPLSGSSRLSESMRIEGEKNAYEQNFSNCMESQGYGDDGE
ncbi:hypothetical protein [Fodinicurvata sediminis]|uniref:hypothetical protein n=1 Tax=Fodinicurvata sediminis TaxID=1121832 RepID=UPI0003B71CEB|nr:hypothetical protein [Fodinicurvata sediminis]